MLEEPSPLAFSSSSVSSPPVLLPPLSLSSSHLPIPRILSYNVHSLSYYASNPRALSRRHSISCAMRDFIKAHDIICLQETHLSANESFAFSELHNCRVSRNGSDMNSCRDTDYRHSFHF